MRTSEFTSSPSHESGFSLIEVMAALFIVSLVSAFMATGFVAQLKYNQDAEIKSAAVSAAQTVLEELRTIDPATMPNSGSTAPESITVGRFTFDVTTSYCSNATYCTSNAFRHVRVSVAQRGQVKYDVETVFSQLR